MSAKNLCSRVKLQNFCQGRVNIRFLTIIITQGKKMMCAKNSCKFKDSFPQNLANFFKFSLRFLNPAWSNTNFF